MSHSIPVALNGGLCGGTVPAIQSTPPQPVQLTQPVVLAATATPARPTYANHAGDEWSTRELQLVEQAFRTGGYEAAYKIVPHRSKPAVRGRLQRAGLIVPRT